ncbi:MAG: TrkA family potassium uptake protein [Halodesulfurarchaeum sp.]
MERTRRRGLYYLLSLVGVLALFTVLYRYGMATYEGEPRTLLESLQIVVETFTTTGYGEDAPWHSPQMIALMVVMQFTGVFFIFLTLPLFLVPWVERRLENRVARSYGGENHVTVCGFSDRTDALVDELESHDVEYVVVVDDVDLARSLDREGYSVVAGDPESTGTLANVNVADARAVVLDHRDEVNATIALSVRELSESVRLVAFVEDPDLSRYLELAGVDEPLQPRELLGRSLADTVSSVITTQLGTTVDIGADLAVIELPVLAGSEIEGTTLRTAGIREETGATVLGAWQDGAFVPNPGPETELDAHTVLLVSGTESQLRAVMERTQPPGRLAHRDVVIAGYGDVGRAVRAALRSAHITCRIVDAREQAAVDVVGNATETDVLREAGIESAGAFIVTLGSDTEAIFATLVARELNPSIEIIARSNDAENAGKLYAAGADYVLPLTTVSGRMLAASILDEDIISYATQIDILRTAVPDFEGHTIGELAIRERIGCTVIAVEREGETLTEVGPDLRIRPGDSLIVAGTDESLMTLQELAGVAEN